jgi:hypothetical protein
MKPLFFYIIVVAMYLSAGFFIYEYTSFNAVTEDKSKVETGIMYNQASAAQDAEMDVLAQEEQNLKYESYGYLAGGAFLVICPTLLLVFRNRLLV